MTPRGEARTSRGADKKSLILETALALLRDRGYEATTMRAIAKEAGVALGAAYYYFDSKENLIQAFYGRSHEDHLEACEGIFEATTDVRERLVRVLEAKLETSEPYHEFAGVLFRTAADPRSPLNPFSPESVPIRLQSTALFARILEGATREVPEDLRRHLPDLLWTYQMGIILFWIHDRSPGRIRTRRLMRHSADLVARLISLASHPLLAPLRRRTVRMLEELDFRGPALEAQR